jgi:hypothetical protein
VCVLKHVDAEIDTVFCQVFYVAVEVERSVRSSEAIEAHSGQSVQEDVPIAAIAFNVLV